MRAMIQEISSSPARPPGGGQLEQGDGLLPLVLEGVAEGPHKEREEGRYRLRLETTSRADVSADQRTQTTARWRIPYPATLPATYFPLESIPTA